MGYTKLICSGNLLEIYEYEKNLPANKIKRKKKYPERYRKLESRRFDNVRRLRKNFYRLVRSNLIGNECPIFLTLTMVEVLRINDAYRLFTEFIQRFRRKYGKCFRYIAVPEFQKRGAVHFHLLVWGVAWDQVSNEAPHWVREEDFGRMDKIERGSRAIQRLWARGFVDCVLTDGSFKLAGYLSKYLFKTLLDKRLMGQKSYVASRNVLRPVSLPFTAAVTHVKELYGIDLSTDVPLLIKEFPTQWLGKGKYQLFNIK